MDMGSAVCALCQQGYYGQDGQCYLCDAARTRCMSEGMDHPEALPGFWVKGRVPASSAPRCRDVGCPGAASIQDAACDDMALAVSVCEPGCPNGVCVTLAECVPQEGCAHGGIGNCTVGYTLERCSACDLQFFRLNGRCEPCPEFIIPFWIYIITGFGSVLGLLLLAEYFWTNSRLRKIGAEQMGTITGPFMVMMTFMQTVGVVLDIPRIKLPEELRELMSMLNVFNFNIELANPECR